MNYSQNIINLSKSTDTVCEGSGLILNAISSSDTIYWYKSIFDTVPIGKSLSGNNFSFIPEKTNVYYADTISGASFNSITYNYTGGVQYFTVPANVYFLYLDVIGAQGGSSQYAEGGKGGRVQAVYPVNPGQTFSIYVGSNFNGYYPGWNGGGNGTVFYNIVYGYGGGGASDIRQNGNSLSDRIIVAGGGGGASSIPNSNNNFGGDGGGLSGSNGGGNGLGGTQYNGGNCMECWINYYSSINEFNEGNIGLGGNGSRWIYINNFGAISSYEQSGGGGGGGYYGGAGGYKGGGGGGSSYTNAIMESVIHTQGYNTGNGKVQISWSETRKYAAVTVLPVLPVSII